MAQDARRSQAAAFATGTMENLLTQWVKFILFCLKFSLVAIPASDVTLAWYAQYLSRKFRSHTSIVNYLSGMKTLHLLLDANISGFKGFLIKLTLRGLRRLNPYVPRQVVLIDPLILLHIRRTLDLQNPLHATFWAICLVSFFLLLGNSNVVEDLVKNPDLTKQLCREDLQWYEQYIRVTLRWTKTNQFGRKLTFTLLKINGSELCPYTAMKNMIGLVLARHGLCFIHADGLPFTYYQYHTLL